MDFLRFLETGIIRSFRFILLLIGAVTGPLGMRTG
jgi:hypothetical protein